MKPKVLFLCQENHPIPPLKGAAVEQWIYHVSKNLHGYEPHIVSVPHPDRPNDEIEKGIHFHRIYISKLYIRLFRKITRWDPYSYLDRVVQYAKKIHPSIIHIHNEPNFVDRLVAEFPATPIILHMHNEKNVVPKFQFSQFVGCSRYICDWFLQTKIKANNFSVLPNGVNIHRFKPSSPEQKLKLQQIWNVPKNKFIVLYAGRISPEKGPDLLVKAMSNLPSKYHLVMVGEWPKGDPLKSKRVAYSNQLANLIDHNNTTIINVIPPDEMSTIYSLADLIVIPSLFEEPFSMVAIESMACGTPVLAIERGGMMEYMIHQNNAHIFPKDISPKKLAKIIAYCYSKPEDLKAYSVNARKMVLDNYSWEQVAQQTENLYNTLQDSKID